ncbi:Fanconi anemia group E protein isoform X2 [Pristis pectinata]|uniref:Fanconi anemia group E protein isoform X2 n=1 Tax=Pristis pectinata TaxID=685728 RepID=UPI00223D4F1A|nr:Fanconi anemia group E protein isoform X2 [Pristis pectinata]
MTGQHRLDPRRMFLLAGICLEPGSGFQNTRKPLFYLLPVLVRRNLLSFLHLASSYVPKDCLHHLISQLKKNLDTDLWIQKLIDVLEQDLEGGSCYLKSNSHSNRFQKQLKYLCQTLVGNSEDPSGAEKRLGWYYNQQNVSSDKSCEGTEDNITLTQNSKKRKNILKGASLLEDDEQNITKKIKLAEDIVSLEPFIINENQGVTSNSENMKLIQTHMQNKMGIVEVEQEVLPKTEKKVDLPEHIKSSVSTLRDIFEADSDKLEPPEELNILNECDPSQLEKLCLLLRLSELSEHQLPLACNKMISLSSDLSYSNATVLARTLFLTRVLSLTEPASRFLTAAITLFCKKYPRPICIAMIGPLLQTPDIGNVQVELICRLMEDCLEPDHLTVTFRHILSVTWSEEILSVVHILLERKVELTSELFEQFIQKLSQQAGRFNNSVKYAKMVLAMLTKYPTYITLVHKNMLSHVLAIHTTFLKKSMQAALKHINI